MVLSLLPLFCGVIVAVYAQTSADGDLRLTDGADASEGRLEVYFDSEWGTVCDDSFGDAEAGVACWQLGYGRHGSNYSTIGVDTSNPPILLDDLDCQGDEERLDQCGHRPWGFNDCKEEEHVAISCQADPCRSSPCMNGATCVPLDDVNVTCACTPITTGERCEHFVNFCENQNGGCSHVCVDNQHGGYQCACPDEELQLGADGHSCHSSFVEVRCGRTMEVAFPRQRWPGLHEQYVTLVNSSCAASGNATHVTLSVPLEACGTQAQRVTNGFIFDNRIVTQNVPVAGLVSRVRDVNMTVRCHYHDELLLDNWYIVNSGQIQFSDVAYGHYELSMDLFHNGQQYVGGPLERVEPGEDLSIKFSLSSNDSSLQVFARNCRAAPASEDGSATQFLFLDEGCGNDPSLQDNRTSSTQETLQLQAFQFTSTNSSSNSTLLMHCDVIVCNVSDPANRCSQGCLAGSDGGDDADGGAGDPLSLRARRDAVAVEGLKVLTASSAHVSASVHFALWMAVFSVLLSGISGRH